MRDKTQDIKALIDKHQEEIDQLLETKRNAKPGGSTFIIAEYAVLLRQEFINELRGLLDAIE